MRKGLLLLLLAACGNDKGDDDVVIDAAIDAAIPDAQLPDAAPPTIGEALDCGDPGAAGGLVMGDDMQRFDLDLAVFPDALCNDGTGAVIYVRPFELDVNRDRWVIQLQGGGNCDTPDLCAARWCSVGTNFGMTQMTANLAPDVAIEGNGILERRVDNPMGGWNQVFVRYCSSDNWSGTRRDVLVDAVHPVSGEQVEMVMHFLGSAIFDAVIATLRQEGVAGLQYDLGGTVIDLPDFDDATLVVLAGASAGGAGVINNIDRFFADLRAANPTITGGGIVDSIFTPSLDGFDISGSVPCTTQGLCDWEALMSADEGPALWGQLGDESCPDWHTTNAPGTEWNCNDGSHVLVHHVVTPYFVRMSQYDSLISSVVVDDLLLLPDADTFASLVRDQVYALADVQTAGEEGTLIPITPGGFSPTCPKHETLRSTPDVFDVTIDEGAGPMAMFDVMQTWLTGGSPSIVVTDGTDVEVCPPP